jgi:predicted small lipoprotein YifL
MGMLALAAGLAVAGCARKKPEYLPPVSTLEKSAGKKVNQLPKEPKRPATVMVLVAYGVDGKPVYAELRQSTGDAALDQRIVDSVLANWTFPPGKADTVLVPVDVRSVARE